MIEVLLAPQPRRPVARLHVEQLRGDRRVFEAAPGAGAVGLEPLEVARQLAAELLRRQEPAACREHIAQVFGEPLVHPQELRPHRVLVVARGKS